MAKRRSGGGGGGSSIGLIITLIFFIVLSLGEGVAIWIFASPREDVVQMERDAASALGQEGSAMKAQGKPLVVGLDKLREVERERDWYRFQAMVYREYMGYPNKAKDEAEARTLALDVREFGEKGNVERKFGASPVGLADVKSVRDALDRDMPWKTPTGPNDKGGELSPRITFLTRLTDQDDKIKKARADADRAQKTLEETQATLAQTEAKLKQSDQVFTKAVDDLRKTAEQDRDNDQKEIRSLQAKLDKENKEKNKELTKSKAAEQARAEAEATLKEKETALVNANKDKTEAVSKLTEAKDQITEITKRLREDEKTLKDRALTAEALKVLKAWPEDKMRWQIIRLDQKGTMPYINLGSGDGIETGLTFSVHAMGRDGKLTPLPKGTVEVIEVNRDVPKLARVRITSVTDPKNDPIVAGDRLFNPTFSPGSPKRVAIAGIAYLGGEATDSSADFRRLLARQGVIVDAYVNTKDDKEPRVLRVTGPNEKEAKGEVTAKLSYLIVADSLVVTEKDKDREYVVWRHPKWNDKEYSKKFADLTSEMQEKARANGVPIISLQRYLDMIGYKPPKVVETRTR